jgi:TonB family protein
MLNPLVDRRTVSRRLVLAALVIGVAVALPASALRAAQATPTTLTGSIYDTSGAVLPGVELTLEDANHAMQPAVTNAAGRFTFSGIAAGRYVLTTKLAGFRALREEFELRNAGDWDRAITLQIGDLRETINVRETRIAPSPQPSEPQEPTRIKVGGNVKAPRKLLDVKPLYPPAMRAAGREGVVPIEAVIGSDGLVSYVRVLSAQVHPDFAIAAVDAVRQWRFSPTLLNGVPVEVVMTVTVSFSLGN